MSNLSRSELGSSSESNVSVSSRTSNRSLRLEERRKSEAGEADPFLSALQYLSQVKAGTVVLGNDVLVGKLEVVEEVALSRGLPPEAISVMLEFAMSLRVGGVTCARVLKFLIPATVVPQEAVVRAVSWLCVGKITISTQVLFLRWVLTVFDMIDSKDNLRGIYGFIFSFVTQETLCPYICHLLYLLTQRESVRPFRVRKLLELQSKMGRQPFLMHLLSLYKVFCPELLTLSLPTRMSGFKNHDSIWKAALSAVQKRNMAQVTADLRLTLGTKDKTSSRKRKLGHLEVLPLRSSVQTTSSNRKVFPLERLHSFSQLLENLHRIELPAQMGSMLSSSLALHYLDYVQDDSAFFRLNSWLGHSLHEEFLFGSDGGQSSSEAIQFLDRLLSTQQFLQEGFSSTEGFLYKFLNVWDGSLLRPQILGLLSDIPVVPSSCISQLLFEPLTQLFFTSTLFFKCSVIECLSSMLLKWLTWHSVYALEDGLDISLTSHTPINMTLSGFKDSVMELVGFVGRLATAGLQLEGCHTLLLSFTLDFYQTVCDIFLKYGLPLVVMPPPGVFFPALLARDSVSVDRLCYIMSRYKSNLSTAKSQEHQTTQAYHISRQTYREFNRYLVFMVSSLWSSKMFLPGTDMEVDEELLAKSRVPEYWNSFDLIHHPAFIGYAIDFHRQCWPERKDLDLSCIKVGKSWEWYLQFLFAQGFQGLQQFIQINIKTPVTAGRGQGDSRASR